MCKIFPESETVPSGGWSGSNGFTYTQKTKEKSANEFGSQLESYQVLKNDLNTGGST